EAGSGCAAGLGDAAGKRIPRCPCPSRRASFSVPQLRFFALALPPSCDLLEMLTESFLVAGERFNLLEECLRAPGPCCLFAWKRNVDRSDLHLRQVVFGSALRILHRLIV